MVVWQLWSPVRSWLVSRETMPAFHPHGKKKPVQEYPLYRNRIYPRMVNDPHLPRAVVDHFIRQVF